MLPNVKNSLPVNGKASNNLLVSLVNTIGQSCTHRSTISR